MKTDTIGSQPTAARGEYQQRLAARQEQVARAIRRENAAVRLRLVAFLAFALVAYAVYRFGIGAFWLALPVAGFVAAVVWHRAVQRSIRRARLAVAYYERCKNRLDDRWPGIGPEGIGYLRAEHPYAGDLDLFGRGSLFQLLSTARTRMGEDTLAAWLLAPADVKTIRERQAAIEELRGELDLRERLAIVETDLQKEFQPEKLRHWATSPALVSGWKVPAIAAVLAVAATVTLVGWLGLDWPLSSFAFVTVLEIGLLVFLRHPLQTLSRELDGALSQLGLLVDVLRLLETRTFRSNRLRELIAELCSSGHIPSAQIRRLAIWVDTFENFRRNQFLAPIGFVLMLVVQVVCAIERWRATAGAQIPQWLDAIGEFEALIALSGYAYEHPGDPFPEIVEEGPLFHTIDLGHPLIPDGRCVRNDVLLDGERRLMLVSGSNMSGKSTLLRSVGANAVLALAGAPVRARELRISPLAIGTAMRVQDSLQEGNSAFFAEIKRLRQIVGVASQSRTVLFLLDEILHGTNSHDRRIGAEAVIRELLDRGGMGLVTTHDLALAEIVETLGPRGLNVHFEDQLVAGRMTFDYRMREGVVPKTNALALMRLLGLDV